MYRVVSSDRGSDRGTSTLAPGRSLATSLSVTTGLYFFFFSSRRRHTRLQGDWSSDVCSSDLRRTRAPPARASGRREAGLGRCELLVDGDVLDVPGPAVVAGVVTRAPGGAGREIGRASCRERG